MLIDTWRRCRKRGNITMRAITSLGMLALGLAVPGIALAGANKTWVSGSGVDSGACQFAAPCKSFQYALTQTSAGGEIDVKDSGGYGTFVITKAISVVAADGVLASISVPAYGTGILVQAGPADHVAIRGLTIDGHLLHGTGIVVQSSVTITKVIARNLDYGINVAADNATAVITDSNIFGCSYGISAQHGSTYISNDHFTRNAYGVEGAYGAHLFTFKDNLFAANDADIYGADVSSATRQ